MTGALPGMTLWLPEVALIPDQSPLAAQLVASVEDQVRVEGEPLLTFAGLALIVTVGAAAAVMLNASAMLSSSDTCSKSFRRAVVDIRFGMGLFCRDDFPEYSSGDEATSGAANLRWKTERVKKYSVVIWRQAGIRQL